MPTDLVSDTDLENAKQDADTLGEVVNGAVDLNSDGTTTSRQGRTLKTLAKIDADFSAKLEEQTVQTNAATADADRAEAAADSIVPSIVNLIVAIEDAGVSNFPYSTANSVSSEGATLNLQSELPTGTYANGDPWVFGQVVSSLIEPASTLEDGTDVGGPEGTYTNRRINDTMVDPGNARYATDQLAANNSEGPVLAYDSLPPNDTPFGQYSADNGVDPGQTGVDLTVSEGTIVKAISQQRTGPRQLLSKLVPFTITSEIPAPDAIRPGASSTSKLSRFSRSDFDLDVFPRLSAPASAPTAAEAAQGIRSMIEVTQQNEDSRKFMPSSYPEYGRDIGRERINPALLSLCLDHSDEELLDILVNLATFTEDVISCAEQGIVMESQGGGSNFRKAAVAIVAASLGSNAPASYATYLSEIENSVFCEDGQVFTVSSIDTALPRYTDDGQTRDPYTLQMLGAVEFGSRADNQPNRSGSNWDVRYRSNTGACGSGSALAVTLVTGARTLWNNEKYFQYYLDQFPSRNDEYISPNNMPQFDLDMIAAYRPTVPAPQVSNIWMTETQVAIEFDQALKDRSVQPEGETGFSVTPVPTNSDFVVRVDGTPVSLSGTPTVFRNTLGLTLANPVTGNEVVDVAYVSGVNPILSVDDNAVSSFTAVTATNLSDRVGGPNAAFPIVEYPAGTKLRHIDPRQLGAADTRRANLFIKGLSVDSLPESGSIELLGTDGGSEAMNLELRFDGLLRLRLYGASTTNLLRINLFTMAPNTSYDVLVTIDSEQTTRTAGAVIYVNGTQVDNGQVNWNGGPGELIDWTRTASTDIGNDTVAMRFGAIWLDTESTIDITNSATRALFTGATGGDLDIQTLGDGVTSNVPSVFIVGDADQHNSGTGINRGTVAKFFLHSGLVTDVSGSEWI